MAAALNRRLRLWFSFGEPVGRAAYFWNGAALMAFKYVVDAAVISLATHRFWTPLDYLNPLWSMRQATLRLAPPWLTAALVVWTLPFLWIGVSMTMRRAVNAGLSAWTCLLFFLPVVNYVWMLALSLWPPLSTPQRPAREPRPVLDERLKGGLQGVAAGVAVTIPTVLVSVFLAKSYANGLFLGTPFSLGALSAYVFNARYPRSLGTTLQVALLSLVVACAAIVLFALEGVVCVAMAFPLAAAVVLLGAILGRAIALHRAGGGEGSPPSHAGAASLLLPLLLLAAERNAPPATWEVTTSVEINAPPARVWEHVVAFADLPPPTEWLFRTGVAAPLRARIDGTGVGAVRYCDFTTGTFVEPITRWDAPAALDFDITARPAPLREWSPYAHVHATHLNGYFRAVRGAFRLTPLPGGRTRLEGRTAYQVEMYPELYWKLFADRIVQAIHLRVLRHVKALAE